MSQNNTIRKSDKKFIAREKGRIRAQFSDVKKQQELIDNLYKRFLPAEKAVEVKEVPSVAKAMEGKVKKVKTKAKK